MTGEDDIREIAVVGLSRGCVGCPVPQRVLDAAGDLAALGIRHEDLPEEIEDMAEIACGPCGDSVLCERVGDRLEISLAKREQMA